MQGCVEVAVMDMCILCAAFYPMVGVCVSSDSVFSALETLAEIVDRIENYQCSRSSAKAPESTEHFHHV